MSNAADTQLASLRAAVKATPSIMASFYRTLKPRLAEAALIHDVDQEIQPWPLAMCGIDVSAEPEAAEGAPVTCRKCRRLCRKYHIQP